MTPIITTLPLAFGVLMGIIGLIFYTAGHPHPFWQRFYAIVPAIVLCCFIPAALNTSGLIASDISQTLYRFCATWLLPAALFLMTLSMDLPRLLSLGWKILILFFAASLTIILSGPLVLWAYKQINPSLFYDDTLWQGFSTVAGSWIGGAANQVAMKELYNVDDTLFGTMILVDTTNASLWLFVIFLLARHATRIDRWLKADTTNLDTLIANIEQTAQHHNRPSSLRDLILILSLTYCITGFASPLSTHIANTFATTSWAAQYSFHSPFFWLVLLTTLAGIALSFTRARQLDHVGASKIGTVFIYLLIAAIGLQINLKGITAHFNLLLIGTAWITLHVLLLLLLARLLRAPIFFLCVASNANTGGASSAPIVATAFHPALAPVGVLLGILGYAIGTIGGYLSAQLMRLLLT